jgi:hypothetical protein
MWVSGQCHAPAELYPRGKDPLCPSDRRLGGPPTACLDIQATGKIFFPLPGIESRSPGRPVHILWILYDSHCKQRLFP